MNTIQTLLTDHIDIWTAADTGPKSGRGRSSANAASVYGIRKLRELILEFAVRGKLVPQDPKDEPASELLNRIQAEKAKLIAMGKINKDKPLPPTHEKDKLFELPCGWEWQRLGNLCVLENGDRGKNYPNKSVLVEAGIPFVNAGHLQNGQIDKNQMTFITEERFGILRGGKFQENDILFCLRGSLGKSALVKGFKEGAIASSLVIIRLLPNLDATYFVNYFDCPLSSKMVKKYDNGTAQPNLSSTDLAKFLVPLPPLAEQHRIVAKVDELMALCDHLETQHNNATEAHEKLVSHLLGTLTQSQCAEDFSANWQRIAAHFDTLFTTETSIDAIKQTLLQLAVMGKLVPQDPNDEPASALLKRIQSERARLFAEGKIKKEKLLPITDEEKPFVLPKGWEWVSLDEISQVGTGATPLRTKAEYFNPGIISWVTSGETSSPFIFETEQYVSPLALKETNLTVYPKGTLIVAMYGQGKTRGQITELMIEACTNQACAAIRLFSSDDLHRKYVKLFFEKIYDEIRELAAGGAQPNLNLSKVKETVLPLPPLPEQHRIVTKVDELMALCEQLKTRITEASQLQKKLADVVVEQAIS
jgi:type I restriction enzyme S subunit